MGDDLFTGEGSSVGSYSDSHLSYYGDKVNPDERPRLTGFMSDQTREMGPETEAKSAKKIVGYQPKKKVSEPTIQGRVHRTVVVISQTRKQSELKQILSVGP